MQERFVNNTDWKGAKKRYELHLEDGMAFLEYFLIKDEKAFLVHTEVPKELEGKGAGSKLVAFALKDLQHRQIRIIPICPFVAAYIRKHREYIPAVDPAHLHLVS